MFYDGVPFLTGTAMQCAQKPAADFVVMRDCVGKKNMIYYYQTA
jgi:hypothetical protein